MNNKWCEICFLINKNKTSAEDLFQTEIINIFEKLGWTRFNKEIEEKRKINIGSASSLIPDIIIKNETMDLFVIELKKPSVKLTERNSSQLFSYMRQLILEIGILINDRIHVFYLPYVGKNRVPIEVMNIEFNDNAQDGLKFIELFSKQSFDYEALLTFCQNQLKNLEAIDYLTSEEYKAKIIELVKIEASKKFDKDIIEIALKNIEIEILNTIDIKESEKFDCQIINTNDEKTNDLCDKEKEIEKVKRRIPRWLNNLNQTNSKILIKALETLYYNESMSVTTFAEHCKGIYKFSGNFNQMAKYGVKNHGKVFEIDGDKLTLWIPVKDFIKESYAAYKNIP